MPALPGERAWSVLRHIGVWDFETPLLRCGDIATGFELSVKARDIQNWANRGFISPLTRPGRQGFLYSLREALKVSVITHLFPSFPLKLATDIACTVTAHAEGLCSNGVDWTELWDEQRFRVYGYEIVSNSYSRGIFVYEKDLAEKIASGVFDISYHIFKAEERIFWTLCRYSEWRVQHPLEELNIPADQHYACFRRYGDSWRSPKEVRNG